MSHTEYYCLAPVTSISLFSKIGKWICDWFPFPQAFVEAIVELLLRLNFRTPHILWAWVERVITTMIINLRAS